MCAEPGWWVEDIGSTYSYNTAQAGGAAYVEALYSKAISMTNCTMTYNLAALQGGAVAVSSNVPGPALQMAACNVSYNQAGVGAAAHMMLLNGSSGALQVQLQLRGALGSGTAWGTGNEPSLTQNTKRTRACVVARPRPACHAAHTHTCSHTCMRAQD